MTMTTTTGDIPLIDFSPFLAQEGVVVGEAPTGAQRKVAEQLHQVNQQHGFLALTNFGMSVQQRNQAFSEAASLFAMPEDFKLNQLTRIKPQTNTGYAPMNSERINQNRPADLKEAFNVRFENDKAAFHAFQNCSESFASLTLDVLWPMYRTLAARYAVACAVALNIPEVDFFARHLQRYDLCTLRFLHYPPCDYPANAATGTNESAVNTTALRIGEHTDFGAFTFLMVHPEHGPAGLQIKPVAGAEVGGAAAGEDDEAWHDVVLPTSSTGGTKDDEPILIVNTGALLARWTNDTWKATAHRVIVPDAATAAHPRYSIACFIDPDQSSLIQVHPAFVQENDEIRYPPITSSDYLAEKLKSMMTPNNVKA